LSIGNASLVAGALVVRRPRVWVSLGTVGLVIREFDPDPALRSVIIRASDFQERAETPVRRSEGPMLGVV